MAGVLRGYDAFSLCGEEGAAGCLAHGHAREDRRRDHLEVHHRVVGMMVPHLELDVMVLRRDVVHDLAHHRARNDHQGRRIVWEQVLDLPYQGVEGLVYLNETQVGQVAAELVYRCEKRAVLEVDQLAYLLQI